MKKNDQKKTEGTLTAFPESKDQVLLKEFKPRCTLPHRVIARRTKCMDGITLQSMYLVGVQCFHPMHQIPRSFLCFFFFRAEEKDGLFIGLSVGSVDANVETINTHTHK